MGKIRADGIDKIRAALVRGEYKFTRSGDLSAPGDLPPARQWVWQNCWRVASKYLRHPGETSSGLAEDYGVSPQRMRMMIASGVRSLLERGRLVRVSDPLGDEDVDHPPGSLDGGIGTA